MKLSTLYWYTGFFISLMGVYFTFTNEIGSIEYLASIMLVMIGFSLFNRAEIKEIKEQFMID